MDKYIKTKNGRILYLIDKKPIKEIINEFWLQAKPVSKLELILSKQISSKEAEDMARNLNITKSINDLGRENAAIKLLSYSICTLVFDYVEYSEQTLGEKISNEKFIQLFCEATALYLYLGMFNLRYTGKNNENFASEVYKKFIDNEFGKGLEIKELNLSDDQVYEYVSTMKSIYTAYLDIEFDSKRKDYLAYFSQIPSYCEERDYVDISIEFFTKRALTIVFSKNVNDLNLKLNKPKISFKNELNGTNFDNFYNLMYFNILYNSNDFREIALSNKDKNEK